MKNTHELFNQAGIYLQQALGEDLLQEGAWEKGVQLPRYVAQTYDMGKARLGGIEVLLMANKDGAQGLPALLKQRALIQKEAGVPVIWVGDTLQAYARKEMVARRMPFIIPFKQAYLPPLGVEFQERALATRVDVKEKLHVATQVFLINTLLGNLPDTLNPKEIAMCLGYSLMTMTRIKSELMEHGWLDIDAYRGGRLWRLTVEGGELWKAIKPYLQSPVRKRLWIRNPNPYIEGLPLAGLSALAKQTMLGEPQNIVRAIGELDWRKLERELDADQIVPEAIDGSLELEVWRYAPQRIKTLNTKEGDANNGIVDPYSLFLSLEAMDDDRVQVALKELLRGDGLMATQVGLKVFEEAFKGFEDQYVLIGGSATQLAMENAGELFSRTTKDLDIVVIVDALTPEFIEKFWEFVKTGEYEIQQKSDATRQFYRFKKPKTARYPFMLELFSRKPDFLRERDIGDMRAIPLAEDVSSLSAILLDDDYYGLIKRDRKPGFIWVDAPVLIPLKAKAWLDLSERKRAGEKIDSDDIKKHLRDVLRLVSILPPDFEYELPESIRRDMGQFLDQAKDESVDLSGLNHPKGSNLVDVLSQVKQAFL